VSANQISLNGHSNLGIQRESCSPGGCGVKHPARLRHPRRPISPVILLSILFSPWAALGATGPTVPSNAGATDRVVSATAGASANTADGTSSSAAGTDTGGTVAATRDPASCQVVRFSDVGWTDVTATTALVSQLLRSIGYDPQITVLSVPVTFASMQKKDIDVFLGNWMPTQQADIKPYQGDASVVVVGANLVGAKYTLAVPAYAYDAGLKDFNDIQRFGAALNNSIYGIEPGNDGNRVILKMLKDGQFGLSDFKLVESSEQGELAQVERAYRSKQPIVFLAWEPHPMNMRFDLKYLDGGDAAFGPNFGGATIYTVTRRGFSADCPNVGHLLSNLKFSLRGESEMMAGILDRHEQPDIAATEWLKANPTVTKAWLNGVLTFEGKPAYAALAHAAPPPRPGFEQWVISHKIPVGDAMATAIDTIKTHGTFVFDGISTVIRGMVNGATAGLRVLPAPLLILAITVLAYVLRRSWALAAFVALALLFILNQGYWGATLETLSLVLVATLASAAIGVPVGIAAAHRPRLFATLRPVLDLMQTLPTFVYLIPTLVLFGLGVVPGLISTVIFALPAPIRLTHLGISSVPRPLIEAGQSFGATPMQLLWKIELPSASTTIIAGVTQCIMLSLSMVVIAALVGAGGLGVPVVRALNSVQVGMGFEAGFTIVLLAIILDRISRPTERGASR
jgi:glycine betaine/proline transport system substrate-binding protein